MAAVTIQTDFEAQANNLDFIPIEILIADLLKCPELISKWKTYESMKSICDFIIQI